MYPYLDVKPRIIRECSQVNTFPRYACSHQNTGVKGGDCGEWSRKESNHEGRAQSRLQLWDTGERVSEMFLCGGEADTVYPYVSAPHWFRHAPQGVSFPTRLGGTRLSVSRFLCVPHASGSEESRSRK